MNCEKCGNPIENEEKFCRVCGAPVNSSNNELNNEAPVEILQLK